MALAGLVNGVGQVVIAYVDNDGMRPTGKMERFDGVNYRPQFEACPNPKAGMWLRKGTTEDAAKARTYLDRDHAEALAREVFIYPASERDPLGRARREIMARVSA